MSVENDPYDPAEDAEDTAPQDEDDAAEAEASDAEDAETDVDSDPEDEDIEDDEPGAGEGLVAAGPEGSAVEEPPAEAVAPPTNENLRWYAVHTYSNFEEKARSSLLEKVKQEGMEHYFGQILVPTEEITEIVGGKKRTVKRRFFPGYMFVEMELTDTVWHLVNNTPKVTGFVGDPKSGSEKPRPLPKREIAKITQRAAEAAVEKKPRVVYVEGETVRVTDGSFANFNAVVEEVKEEQQRLRVLVSIFGRPTPVEVAFDQVEKVLK